MALFSFEGVNDDGDREEEGVARFYVNDPFGNRIEFMEREARMYG
jgi:hypothetical protein